MAVERIDYQAGNAACNGALVYDERVSGRRPLLLMAPNWLGVTDDAIKRAAAMAGSKYVAFVADMYGGGKISQRPAGSRAPRQRRCAPTRPSGGGASPARSMRCAAKATSARSAISSGRRRSASASAAAMCWNSRAPAPTCRPCLPARRPAHAAAGQARATSMPRSACCTARKIRWCRRRTATFSKRKWKRPARNGRCWSSAACCIRSARSNPTCRASHVTTPAPRGRATT